MRFRLSAPSAPRGRSQGRVVRAERPLVHERGGPLDGRGVERRRGHGRDRASRARAARGCSRAHASRSRSGSLSASGSGLVAIVTLPSVFGYQSLTVVSGSMVPTLGVGSVVIDEVIAPADARPGDIVTFKDPLHPRQLTHRLQKVRVEGDTVLHDHPGRRERRARALVRAAQRPHRPRGGALAEARDTRAPGSARATPASARSALVLLLGALMLVDIWRPRRSEHVKRWRGFGVLVALARWCPPREAQRTRPFGPPARTAATASRRAASSWPTTTAGRAMLSFSGGYPGNTDDALHQGHLHRLARRGRAPVRDHHGHRPRPVPRPQGHARHLQPSNPGVQLVHELHGGRHELHRRRRRRDLQRNAPGLRRQLRGRARGPRLSGSPETWTASEKHVYRIQVTLQNNAAAAGKNATQDFTWEARNQ